MAGGSVTRDIIMRVRSEGAEQAAGSLNALKGSWTELNSIVQLSKEAFALAKTGLTELFQIIERGQGVAELEYAFSNLQSTFGNLASSEMPALRSATQGLISDLDLMRASNQALQSGMTPDTFRQLAEAADTLGDVVGKDTKSALDDLTLAMAKGSDRFLIQYGLTIDNNKALADYAKSIGTTADKLSEIGKVEAMRVAILEAIREKTAQVSGAQDTAGDALQRVNVSWNNLFNTVAVGVTRNENLRAALDELNKALQNVDASALIEALSQMATLGIKAATAIAETAGAISKYLANDPATHLDVIAQKIDDANGRLQELYAQPDPQNWWDKHFGPDKQKQVEDVRNEITGLRAESDKYELALVSLGKTVTDAPAPAGMRKHKGVSDHIDETKSATEATNKLKDAIDATTKATKQFVDDTHIDQIKKQLQDAASAGDTISFDRLGDNLRQQIYQKIIDGAGAAANDPAFQASAKEQAHVMYEALKSDTWDKGLEYQKDIWQESADFFSDALYNAMTGAAFDAKDIMMRILAGVAGGFIAQLTGGLGAGFTSLQGLGQTIGASILTGSFGSGAVGGAAAGTAGAAGAGFGGLVGGGAGLASLIGLGGGTSAGIPAGAIGSTVTSSGAPAYMMADGSVAAAGGPNFGATLASMPGFAGLGVAAGVAAGGYSLYNTGSNAASNPNAQNIGSFGLDTMFPGFGSIASAAFGGGSKSQGESWREQWVKQFKGQYGKDLISLDADTTKMGAGVDDQLSDASEALGFLLQGDTKSPKGKGANWIAAMLAEGATKAGDLSDAMFQLQTVFDKTGQTADTAKQSLMAMFLDGKMSLEDYGQALNGINELTDQDLGSMENAWSLLAKHVGGPPSESLRAFQMLLSEASSEGITDMGQLADVMGEKFGDNAKKLFDDLAAAGITSFEQLNNLSADQLFLLITDLKQLGPAAEKAGKQAEEGIAGGFERAAKRAKKAAAEIVKEVGKVGKEAKETQQKLEDMFNAWETGEKEPPNLNSGTP